MVLLWFIPTHKHRCLIDGIGNIFSGHRGSYESSVNIFSVRLQKHFGNNKGYCFGALRNTATRFFLTHNYSPLVWVVVPVRTILAYWSGKGRSSASSHSGGMQ